MRLLPVAIVLIIGLLMITPVSAGVYYRCAACGTGNITTINNYNYYSYKSTWYDHNVASPDIAGYYIFNRTYPYSAEGSFSATANVVGTEYLLGAFATNAGDPNLDTFPAGERTWHTYSKVSSTAGGNSYIKIRFYKRSTSGTETELYNLSTSALSTTVSEDVTTQTVNYDIPLNTSDRFVAKYYAYTSSSSKPTITLYFDDYNYASNAESPIFTINNIPIVNESYAYLPGRAGGQELTGGTAANDDLILNGTSSSTKTSSYIILQPGGGNVGIGTTTPTSVLELYGTAAGLKIRRTSGEAHIILSDAAGSKGGQIRNIITGDGGIKFANIALTSVWALFNGNTGYFAIGDINPTAQLHTTGTVRFANYGAGTCTFDAGGNITSVSDSKYKTNIKPLKTSQKKTTTTAVQKIQALAPVSYKYSQDSGLDTTNTYTGFLAQDVEAIIPDAVSTKADVRYEQKLKKKGATEEENEYETIEVPTGTFTKSLDDRAIIAQLVLAIQEQQAEIDTLQARIDKLEKKS